MQFISAKPLIEKFRNKTFREEEVAPYFILCVLFEVLSRVPLPMSRSEVPWNMVSWLAEVPIHIWGLLYLRRLNGGTFGDGFLSKYFAFGWVAGFRSFILGVPVGITLVGLGGGLGGNGGADAMAFVISVAITILCYYWTGSFFRQIQTTAPESNGPSVPAIASQGLV